jgi:hypothetical protein
MFKSLKDATKYASEFFSKEPAACEVELMMEAGFNVWIDRAGNCWDKSQCK